MLPRPYSASADDSGDAGVELASAVRNSQILVGAIAFGAILFLLVAIMAQRQGWGPRPAARPQPILTYVALALAASIVPVMALLPAAIHRAGRRRIRQSQGAEVNEPDARRRLAGMFLRKTIILAALAEGPAFLAAVAFLIEGQLAALVVAAIMIGLVIWQFPSAWSAERWVDEQFERLSRETP